MNFLHSQFDGGTDSIAEITLDSQANVMLLDETNFRSYQRGSTFRYIGGWAKQSPVRLSPSHHGHWHIVVDLGGYSGQVRAGIRVFQHN